MWVLSSGYCAETNKELAAREMYHMPGDEPGGVDTFCICHDAKVNYLKAQLDTEAQKA
jgi:hypothetical protein